MLCINVEIERIMLKIIFNFQLEITVYMTPQSVLAIQYLNILNPAVNRPECRSTPIPPNPNPNPGQGVPPGQPVRPANPNEIWWWVICCICLSTLLVIVILVGVYCIVDIRHRRSHEFTNK